MEERTVVRSLGQRTEIFFERAGPCTRWEEQGRFSIGRRRIGVVSIVTSHESMWCCLATKLLLH